MLRGPISSSLIEHGDENEKSPLIAEIYTDGGALPSQDNAQLIAAAPDMREALHSIAVQSWSNPQEAITCIEYARNLARGTLAKVDSRILQS